MKISRNSVLYDSRTIHRDITTGERFQYFGNNFSGRTLIDTNMQQQYSKISETTTGRLNIFMFNPGTMLSASTISRVVQISSLEISFNRHVIASAPLISCPLTRFGELGLQIKFHELQQLTFNDQNIIDVELIMHDRIPQLLVPVKVVLLFNTIKTTEERDGEENDQY